MVAYPLSRDLSYRIYIVISEEVLIHAEALSLSSRPDTSTPGGVVGDGPSDDPSSRPRIRPDLCRGARGAKMAVSDQE